MFSNLSSNSISLATVTPSFVTVGEPQLFSITTLRPRGPSVTRTAFARPFTPARSFSRAFWWYRISFAAMTLSASLLEDREDVFLAQDGVLFSVDLDLAAGVLAEEDAIALLHVEGPH